MTSLSSAYAGHGIVNTLILDDFAAASASRNLGEMKMVIK